MKNAFCWLLLGLTPTGIAYAAPIVCDVAVTPGVFELTNIDHNPTVYRRCDSFEFPNGFHIGATGFWYRSGCAQRSDGPTEFSIEKLEDLDSNHKLTLTTHSANGDFTRFWFILNYSSWTGNYGVKEVESQVYLSGNPLTTRYLFSVERSFNGVCRTS